MRAGIQAAILALAGLCALPADPRSQEPAPPPPEPEPSTRPAAPPSTASPAQSRPAPPAADRRRGPSRPRGAPQRDPRAEEILRAVLDTHGGEEYLRSIRTLFVRSRHVRGTGEQAEESLITRYWKEPNRYRQEVDSPAGLFVMAYNGRYAWNELGQGVALAPRSSYRDIEDIVRDINEPLSHLDPGNSLAYQGEQDLDARKVDVLLVTRPSGKLKKLYIDRETRRVLMKEVSQYEDPETVVARRKFSDFRQVGRTWIPFLEEDLSAETSSRVEVVDFIPNQAIDDRVFDSPVPPFDEALGSPPAPQP